MQVYFIFILFFAFCNFSAISSYKTVYSSLDKRSISQLLAYYNLYPDTVEGKKALQEAWQLLLGEPITNNNQKLISPSLKAIESIVTLINKSRNEDSPLLDEEVLQVMDKVGARLKNRKLKGCHATKNQQIIDLPSDEIDLARGLFLSQLGEDEEAIKKVRSYESLIDLMTLQILTKVDFDALPQVKIKAINDFIFDEMGFCFPPHSIYAENVDLYTFLPSVIDSRKGVCLGVSILYLCIAQRVGLNLEAVTPPGHIYLRYKTKEKEINIETTARGIHLHSEEYLSVETRSLQTHTIKEVIGAAHINQASIYWRTGDYEKSLRCYETAKKYMPTDMLLKEFMGYNLLFLGKKEEGEILLKSVKDYLPDYAVVNETVSVDYLSGLINAEGIKALFLHVDQTRASILSKKMKLEEILLHYPKFREGLLQLATTWIQLHRQGEALEILQKYHQIDSHNPTVEYYLSALSMMRHDFNAAWRYYRIAEKITSSRGHFPKALKELKRELSMLSPEP